MHIYTYARCTHTHIYTHTRRHCWDNNEIEKIENTVMKRWAVAKGENRQRRNKKVEAVSRRTTRRGNTMREKRIASDSTRTHACTHIQAYIQWAKEKKRKRDKKRKKTWIHELLRFNFICGVTFSSNAVYSIRKRNIFVNISSKYHRKRKMKANFAIFFLFSCTFYI